MFFFISVVCKKRLDFNKITVVVVVVGVVVQFYLFFRYRYKRCFGETVNKHC